MGAVKMMQETAPGHWEWVEVDMPGTPSDEDMRAALERAEAFAGTFEVVDSDGEVRRFEEHGAEWSDEFLGAIQNALWVGGFDGEVIQPGAQVVVRRVA